MAQGLIKARRRLTELYKTGVEIRVGGRYGLEGAIAQGGSGEFKDEDGELIPLLDDEVAMWVQPPSPVHRDMALRNANAARTRASMVAKKDTESPDYLQAKEFVESMSDETLYDYVLVGDMDRRQQEAVREVLAEEEWADVTELQESLRIFEEENRPEDDPEVQAVRERENELQSQVATREHELWEAELDVLRMKGVENARKRAMERHLDLITAKAFMIEYERQMHYFSVRDADDHGVMFFESAYELASQPDEILTLVQTALDAFIRDGAEAKNSPRAESGSALSAPPSKPATSESSTPEESIA